MKGKIFNKNLMKFSYSIHVEEKNQKIKIFTCPLHSSIIFICVTINSLQQFETGAKSILSLTMTLPLNARSRLI